MPRYIVVHRQSPTSRYLDVQLEEGQPGLSSAIAVFDGDPTIPYLDQEDALVSYINGSEIEPRAVSAELAHKVLGWSVK